MSSDPITEAREVLIQARDELARLNVDGYRTPGNWIAGTMRLRVHVKRLPNVLLAVRKLANVAECPIDRVRWAMQAAHEIAEFRRGDLPRALEVFALLGDPATTRSEFRHEIVRFYLTQERLLDWFGKLLHLLGDDGRHLQAVQDAGQVTTPASGGPAPARAVRAAVPIRGHGSHGTVRPPATPPNDLKPPEGG